MMIEKCLSPLMARFIRISSKFFMSSGAVTSQRYDAVSNLVALTMTKVAGSRIFALFAKSPGRNKSHF